MEEQTVLAWHLVGDKLLDGTPTPRDGEWLEIEGELEMCKRGFHASERALCAVDNSNYLTFSTLDPFFLKHICRVECGGTIHKAPDKLVCSKRKILWRVDKGPVLWAFARWCALQCIDDWDPSKEMLEYLKTGSKKSIGKLRKAPEADHIDFKEPDGKLFYYNEHLVMKFNSLPNCKKSALTAAETFYEGREEFVAPTACTYYFQSIYDKNMRSLYPYHTLDKCKDVLEFMIHEARDGKTEWVFE